MLKTCFECLAGDNSGRVGNDVYGVRMNGDTQTMISKIENEDVFNLPRRLHNNDMIMVQGIMPENKESLYFKLKTGTPSPDNQSFALQMRIDFSEDIIAFITNNSGQEIFASQKPSRILSNSSFILRIVKRTYDDLPLVDVFFGDNAIETLQLDNTFENVTFFTLTSDAVQVKELTFSYS